MSMKIRLYVYTGTGNSLWVARQLATELKKATIGFMPCPQLQRLMANRKLALSLGYSVGLPSNYIPWGGPGPMDKQQKLFKQAREKVKAIAGSVLRRERTRVDRGPLWQNILFSLLYRMSFRQVRNMDKKFRADEKCNNCGICSQVCPAANIEMTNGKP